MKNYLRPFGLRKVAESLFNSKIRYGLQMCGQIRWKDSDPTPNLMKDLQICQNKMLRLLNNSRISDKISTASLLVKVNQINAQIKLSEMWKAVKDEDHPFNIVKWESWPDVRSMRSISNESKRMHNLCISKKRKQKMLYKLFHSVIDQIICR